MVVKRSPLLNRKDLVAQFEVCVKQEIAEHKKHVEQCNEVISTHAKEIRKVKDDTRDRLNFFDTCVHEVIRRLDDLERMHHRVDQVEVSIREIDHDRHRRLEKRIQALELAQQAVAQSDDLSEQKLLIEQKIASESEEIWDKLHKLESMALENSMQVAALHECVNDLSGAFRNVKREMQSGIDCVNERCDMRQKEYSGFEKRFKDINKLLFICEKKIEYLNNQIQRLRSSSV